MASTPLVFDKQYYSKLYEMMDANEGDGRDLGRYIDKEKDGFSITFQTKYRKKTPGSNQVPLREDEVDPIITFIEEDSSLAEPRIRSIEFTDFDLQTKCVTKARLTRLFSAIEANKRLERLELCYASFRSPPFDGTIEKIAAAIKDKHYLRVLIVTVLNGKIPPSLQLLEAALTCPNLEYLDVNFATVKEDMMEPAVKMIEQHILNFSRLNTVRLTLPGDMQTKTMEAICKPLHSKSIHLLLDSPQQSKECQEVVMNSLLRDVNFGCLLNGINLDNICNANMMENFSKYHTSVKKFSCEVNNNRSETLWKEIMASYLTWNGSLQQVFIPGIDSVQIKNKLKYNQGIWHEYLKNLCPTIMEASGNKFSIQLTAMIADYIDEYRCDLENLTNPLKSNPRYATMQVDFQETDLQRPGVGYGLLWLNSRDHQIPLKYNHVNVTHNQWKRLAEPQIPLPPKKEEDPVLSDHDIVANDILVLPCFEAEKSSENSEIAKVKAKHGL